MPPDEVDPLDEARAAHVATQPQNGTAGTPKRKAPPQTGSDFENKGGEAHLLWGEMLARGYQPDQFRLNVRRLEPPTSMGTQSYPALDGAVVRNGPDALYNYIAEYYHLPGKPRGTARFEVSFFEKANGQCKSRGYIVYPSQEEMLAARPQVVDATVGAVPRPWQQPSAQPAPYYAPPQMIGQPQQPAPVSSDPNVAALQAQVANLNGQLTQVLAALGQQPHQAPPQPQMVAAPPSGVAGLKDLVSIIESLRGCGLIPPAGGAPPAAAAPAVAAPPVAVASAVPQDPLGQIIAALDQLKGLTRVRNVASEVLEGLAGVEGGADPKDPEAPAGEAALPWQRVQLGNFAWAISKEDGSWSPQGILAEMMNAPEGSPLANTRKTVLELATRVVNVGEALARKGIPGLLGGAAPGPAAQGGSGQGGGSGSNTGW